MIIPSARTIIATGSADKDQRHGGAVAEGVAKCLGHFGPPPISECPPLAQ